MYVSTVTSESIQTPWREFVRMDWIVYCILTQYTKRTKWTWIICMYGKKKWNLILALVFRICVAVRAVWQWWQQEVFLGVILSALHTWMLSHICPCRFPHTCQLGCERFDFAHSMSMWRRFSWDTQGHYLS